MLDLLLTSYFVFHIILVLDLMLNDGMFTEFVGLSIHDKFSRKVEEHSDKIDQEKLLTTPYICWSDTVCHIPEKEKSNVNKRNET